MAHTRPSNKQAENKLGETSNRDRIIAAAREMMRDERAKFSMRELAERAGVSLATPYNLFGSKKDIIAAVMDADLGQLGAALRDVQAEPLDAFFSMADVTGDMLAAAPQYYKAGAQTFDGDAGSEMQLLMRAPRHLFIRNMVEQAVQAGCLDHQINLDAFALNIGQQFYGWIQVWARDQVGIEEFKARVGYGFALALAAVATDQHRKIVQSRLMKYQSDLQEFDRINAAKLTKLRAVNKASSTDKK